MTEPRPADCTSPCIACMTDESHDPTPAPLSPPPTDRAAVLLREQQGLACPQCGDTGACNGGPCALRDLATRELRRMADEAETGGAW
ncbi:hypothetical protein [Streptomyces koyangensis]